MLKDLNSRCRYCYVFVAYSGTFDVSKFLLKATVCIFLKYSCLMIVILKLIACDRQVNLCVYSLLIFCELTSQDYASKIRIRLIEKQWRTVSIF